MNKETVLRRAPKQERSRATYDKILTAAEELMRHRGTDDFTLAEVCKLAKVSMGAIYDKFESKDDLVHAVHDRMIVSVNSVLTQRIEAVAQAAKTLGELIPGIVEVVGETFREFAPILRPMILRSAVDRKIEENGYKAHFETVALVHREILAYRQEITHPDPDHAASAAYSLADAALARFLGLGAPKAQVADVMDWHARKQDVALMCLAFLKLDPELAGLRI